MKEWTWLHQVSPMPRHDAGALLAGSKDFRPRIWLNKQELQVLLFEAAGSQLTAQDLWPFFLAAER